MKKFEVEIREIEIYNFEIEAETEEEAIDKAWEIMDTEDILNHHSGSDGESSACEI